MVLATTLLLGPLAAHARAQSDADYVGAQLRLRAVNARGHQTHLVLPGERWRVAGTLRPAVPGARVRVAVSRDEHPLIAAGTRVRRDGRFSVPVRVKRPGRLSVRAAVEGAPDLTDQTSVRVPALGRPHPGCLSRAIVVSNLQAAPARAVGAALRRQVLLDTGAVLDVPRGGVLRIRRGRGLYHLERGRIVIGCNAVIAKTGLAFVHGPGTAQVAAMTARVDAHSAALVAARPVQVRFSEGTGNVFATAIPTSRIRTVKGDIVVPDGPLPRMSTWPFARSPEQRPVRPADHVPDYWADGQACSSGCRPAIGRRGWPLKPFHQQHPLRSGLNEWRPANMHIGIDIQAYGEQQVYAIQGGRAHIEGAGTADEHIDVGSYEYWHVVHRVYEGQYVRPYKTLLGRLYRSARHLHVSEMPGYRNPLRPGGINLSPYRDDEAPVIGRVEGATVEVFDPQTVRKTIYYRTPVLAPAAVAYRAYDAGGHDISGLRFAYRGSQHLSSKSIYAASMHPPASPDGTEWSWACFDSWTICTPRWQYNLPGLPGSAASVRVYAQDWAGNMSTRESNT